MLEAKFKGAKLDLRPLPPGRRFYGALIWPGFEGMEHLARQTKMHRVIDAALSDEELSLFSMIVALTPREATRLDDPL